MRLPSAMDAVPLLTFLGYASPRDADLVGHMDVPWYASRFDEATWHVMSAAGVSERYMRTNGRGLVAIRQCLDLLQTVRAGESIAIYSEIVSVGQKSIAMAHRMQRADGTAVATAETTGVHIDTVSLLSCALPTDILKQASALCSPQN
ncbi:acyl-CoA thioesterase [Kribbella sp. NPDC055071]